MRSDSLWVLPVPADALINWLGVWLWEIMAMVSTSFAEVVTDDVVGGFAFLQPWQ